MNAQKLDKWKRTVAKLNDEITYLHHDRRIWRIMMDALGRSTDAEYFQAHYTRLYVDRSVSAVRRLVFGLTDQKALALDRLLDDIADNGDMLTADRHAEIFADTVPGSDYGRERFDDVWGDGTGRLDVNAVRADRQRVIDAAQIIKDFADRTVAHIDRRGFDGTIRFSDLDNAIDTIGTTFRKYQELIGGSAPSTSVPTPQGDWAAPFRFALFGDDEPDE